MPRFHCPVPLTPGDEIALPPGAARHVQVLRLQPGDAITLFHGGADGPGGEFEATVTRMGRTMAFANCDLRVGARQVLRSSAVFAFVDRPPLPAREGLPGSDG